MLSKPDLVNCRYQTEFFCITFSSFKQHHCALENKLKSFLHSELRLGGVLDPQKFPKPEPEEMGSFWVMQQSPPCCVPSSEAGELGLCAGKELLIKNWLPVHWGSPCFRYSLCKHNTYLRAGAIPVVVGECRTAVPEVPVKYSQM